LAAPEVFLNNVGGSPVDMWGLGCVTYLLYVGEGRVVKQAREWGRKRHIRRLNLIRVTGAAPFNNSNSVLLKEEIVAGKVNLPDYLSPAG
jgi:hypothetical protein